MYNRLHWLGFCDIHLFKLHAIDLLDRSNEVYRQHIGMKCMPAHNCWQLIFCMVSLFLSYKYRIKEHACHDEWRLNCLKHSNLQQTILFHPIKNVCWRWYFYSCKNIAMSVNRVSLPIVFGVMSLKLICAMVIPLFNFMTANLIWDDAVIRMVWLNFSPCHLMTTMLTVHLNSDAHGILENMAQCTNSSDIPGNGILFCAAKFVRAHQSYSNRNYNLKRAPAE